MKRLYNPMLFLLANAPEVEKSLELLMTMLQATNDSIRNIKNGIDNFHTSVQKIAESGHNPSPVQNPPDYANTPAQTPEPTAAPEPSPEQMAKLEYSSGTVIIPEPAPVIQMPGATPPLS